MIIATIRAIFFLISNLYSKMHLRALSADWVGAHFEVEKSFPVGSGVGEGLEFIGFRV